MNHLFRISLCRAVFALAAMLFVSTVAFAGDAIPGVNVGRGRNPGGSIINTKTDSDGKFTFAKSDSGSYNITFADDEKFMPFNLKFAPGFKVMVNGRQRTSRSPIVVRATTKIMVIAVSHEITISGTITTVDTAK